MKRILLSILCITVSFVVFSQSVDVPLVNASFKFPDNSSKDQCQQINSTDLVAINDLTGFGWRIENCNDMGGEEPKKFGAPNKDEVNSDPVKCTYKRTYVAFSYSSSGKLYQVTEMGLQK